MQQRLWTVADLAEASGLSDRWIRRLIEEGKIKAIRVGWSWLISDEEAQRFLRERGKTENK